MIERDIQTQILDALRACGFWAHRLNTGRFGSRHVEAGLGKGSPDVVVILRPSGRFVGLEIKRPGQKPKAEQVAWGEEVAAHGACYAVVTCVADALAAVRTAR